MSPISSFLFLWSGKVQLLMFYRRGGGGGDANANEIGVVDGDLPRSGGARRICLRFCDQCIQCT